MNCNAMWETCGKNYLVFICIENRVSKVYYNIKETLELGKSISTAEKVITFSRVIQNSQTSDHKTIFYTFYNAL